MHGWGPEKSVSKIFIGQKKSTYSLSLSLGEDERLSPHTIVLGLCCNAILLWLHFIFIYVCSLICGRPNEEDGFCRRGERESLINLSGGDEANSSLCLNSYAYNN